MKRMFPSQIYTKGIDKNELFLEEGYHTRDELRVPYNMTTDPQAELMIRGVIRPEYIKSIRVKDWGDIGLVEQSIRKVKAETKVPILVDKRYYFVKDCGYEIWARVKVD